MSAAPDDRHADALRGRGCLLTAASGGIGREIARALAARGVRLVLSGRRDAELAALAAELRDAGADAVHAPADLADAAQVEALAARATADLGAVDVLVNCAGVFRVQPLGELTAADYAAVFDVNVRAAALLTARLAPPMAARGWGRVVNVGSSSAYAGFADTALYCASKHALLGLSRAAHAEFRDRGVRVFCISPGSVKTDMGRQVPRQEWDTFIEPADVAAYVAFAIGFDGALVSEELRLNRLTLTA